MNPLAIGIDLDGCAYNFVKACRNYLADRHGYNPDTMPNPTCWDFFDHDWGIPADLFFDLCAQGVDEGFIFRVGKPSKGVVECLSDLRAQGHTIHIVTHRMFGKRAVENTMGWLQEYEVPYDTITFAKDKSIIKTDVFIEDNVDNYRQLVEAGVIGVLYDRPYNEYEKNALRVNSWAAFYDLIQKIEKEPLNANVL